MIRPHLMAQLQPFFYDLAHYWIGMTWYFQEVNLQQCESTRFTYLRLIKFREMETTWPRSILLLAM